MDQTRPVYKKKPIFDRRSTFFAAVSALLFIVLLIVLINMSESIKEIKSGKKGWEISKMREYAIKLKSENLPDQTAQAYEEYLDKSSADGKSRSNIYYAIGEIFVRAKRYEDALSYFYKAEIAYPATELKQEIGSYIVTCLENMGRSLDAEYQLESRASLSGEKKAKKAAGDIVAKIGNREITMGEINQALEKLPQWLKGDYDKDESKKLEFLKQYVGNELLYNKGVKLGINKSEEVREQASDFVKQLVVQKVVSDEVLNKIKIDPDDIKNYYEANKDKYKDEDGKKQLTFDEAKEKVAMDYQQEKSQKLVQELFSKILQAKDVQIHDWKFKDKSKKKK